MQADPDTMFVVPARAGLRVVDPETKQPLPAEGARVRRSTYWIRRRQQGDVLEVPPTPEPPAMLEQPGVTPAAVTEEAPRRATRPK